MGPQGSSHADEQLLDTHKRLPFRLKAGQGLPLQQVEEKLLDLGWIPAPLATAAAPAETAAPQNDVAHTAAASAETVVLAMHADELPSSVSDASGEPELVIFAACQRASISPNGVS
jgi:hypothetical protein